MGQSFFNKSREFEHQSFLDWLIVQAVKHDVDAIIVAGDIFDTTTPPSYARELYYCFVAALFKHNIQLLLLGGNHDSVAVLNESKSLFSKMNTCVIPSTGIALNEQVVILQDKDNLPGAVVCAVPFVRAHDVQKSQANESADDKKKALEQAIASHYKTLYELAQKIQAEVLETHKRIIPIIATGHLAAVGIALSDSVRDIYIGTLSGFSAKHFPPADYIALGHIHKPQCIGGKAHIRYSGSPIALSFDEINTQKEITLVSFSTLSTIEPRAEDISLITKSIEIPVFRRLAVVRGDLISISKQVEELKKTYDNELVWLTIEIEKDDYLSDLLVQIQNMIGEATIEVLQIKRVRSSMREILQQSTTETLDDLQPLDVFEKRLAIENIDDKGQEQAIRERFRNILEELSLNQGESIQRDTSQIVTKSMNNTTPIDCEGDAV